MTIKESKSQINSVNDMPRHIPKVNPKDVKWLWDVSYYDGKLSGVCEYRGRKCWIDFADEGYASEKDDHPRIYVIVDISTQDYLKLLEAHNLWKQIYPGKKNGIEQKSKITSEEYKIRREQIQTPDFSDHQIIAWYPL
jgi:hypothetical protein